MRGTTKDIYKSATSFGKYEEAKSKIKIDIKIASILRKKNKLVKKLKERFGRDEEEEEEKEEDDDDEEEEQGQAPWGLTQDLGEDQAEEGEDVEEKEVEKASKDTKAKKRKDKVKIEEKIENPMKKP